jgi:hypothetical protein
MSWKHDAEARQLISETVARAKLGRNGWARAHCPFCVVSNDPDKRWSWGYNVESGYWHCFRCRACGMIDERERLVTFVAKPHEHVQPTDDMPLPSGFVWLGAPAPEQLADLIAQLFPSPLLAAQNYVVGRGVDLDFAVRNGWGFVPSGRDRCKCCEGKDWCRWRGRLIMPVLVAGVRVGWVGRSLQPRAKIPYLYPDGMPRGNVLINQDVLFDQTRTDPVMQMEGWLDLAPYAPYVDCVGSLGKPGDAHVELLGKSHRPIVSVLDGDAWKEARTVAELLAFLHPHKRSGFLRLPPKQDPNDEARRGLRDKLITAAWRTVGCRYRPSEHPKKSVDEHQHFAHA